jgi:hypothetical protein
MGCRHSHDDSKSINIEAEWEKQNLPKIDKNLFENDSEIILFKTINIIRHNP